MLPPKPTHLASALAILLLITTVEYCAAQPSYTVPMNRLERIDKSPPGSDVKVAPYTSENTWIVSYYHPYDVYPYYTQVWQFSDNDMAMWDLDPDNAYSRPLPPSIRSAFSFAYISPPSGNSNTPFHHYISVGGVNAQGADSHVTMDYRVGISPSGGLFAYYDSGSFPPFPYKVAGAVMASDTTAPLQFDDQGNANASIYLFGGKNSTHLSSTMYFSYSPPGASNPTEWIEIEPESEEVPSARMDAASVQKDGFWYIFGGRNSTGSFGDMWQFEFKTRKWTLLADSGYIATPEAESPPSSPETGGNPSPRYGHAMTLVKPGSSNLLGIASEFIVLAGGTNGETFYGDAWVFNLETKSFSRIHLTGDPYEPCAWLGLFTDPSKPIVYLYGGKIRYNAILTSGIAVLDLRPTPTGASPHLSPSPIYLIVIALLALVAFS